MPLLSLPTDTSSVSADKLCSALSVDASNGLSEQECLERSSFFGWNVLPTSPPTPFWRLVLAQFDDSLVRILLSAAVGSYAVSALEGNYNEFVDPLIIMLILILNAIVGVWQERKAESSIDALKEYIPSSASVVRDGALREINAEHLVPGDIVVVSVGNTVPADIRVIKLESTTLRIDESVLTGESEEVIKQSEEVRGVGPERYPANMIYSGTAVVYGKAIGVVVRTGRSTELGRIDRDVREQEEVRTPLQRKLDEFGLLLSKFIGGICLAVFVMNLFNWFRTHNSSGEPWHERYIHPVVYSMQVAVALAVAAIPEGLPVVVTICLARGTRLMAKNNALVRDLPSVETLGRCTVICSDKTGTLTTNKMSVVEVVTVSTPAKVDCYELDDSKLEVIPNSVSHNGKTIRDSFRQNAALDMLSTTAVLCNDAALHFNAAHGVTEKIGDATEAAMLVMAEKLALEAVSLNGTTAAGDGLSTIDTYRTKKEKLWRRDATLEFTRTRKSMSVCCTSRSNQTVTSLFVKGAPEELLLRSSRIMLSDGRVVQLTKAIRDLIEEKTNAMANSSERALRCIGFAFRPLYSPVSKLTEALSDPHHFKEVEKDLTFLGVCGLRDPPRREVGRAIAKCQDAGIRVIVITGDKKETAEAICRQIGLLPSSSPLPASMSYTGADFEKMTLPQKREAVRTAVVFSRTEPWHKMQLVKLLQEQREVCAMTGDGVNDSPALKCADIGIAMGTGTEVAKEASKMVLADDNFATVVKAIREGRVIFDNTKQFIRYLISSNIGEVACVLLTGLCGLPEALTPCQLLWVNLVTDGLPATALAFNSPDRDVMSQPPRPVDEPIVSRWLLFRYIVVGVYVGLATVGGFLWWFATHGFTWKEVSSFATCTDMTNAHCAVLANPETARTVALSILVLIEMFNAFNALSENQSLIVTRPSSNIRLVLAAALSLFLHVGMMYIPFFSNILGMTPLGVDQDVVRTAQPWTILVPTSFTEWKLIFVLSFPVIFIDEVLKAISRR